MNNKSSTSLPHLQVWLDKQLEMQLLSVSCHLGAKTPQSHWDHLTITL
jgi:hypothetical protein